LFLIQKTDLSDYKFLDIELPDCKSGRAQRWIGWHVPRCSASG